MSRGRFTRALAVSIAFFFGVPTLLFLLGTAAQYLPIEDNWFGLPLVLIFFLPPALLFGPPHFTLWMPHPITTTGWALLVGFYLVLSLTIAGAYSWLGSSKRPPGTGPAR